MNMVFLCVRVFGVSVCGWVGLVDGWVDEVGGWVIFGSGLCRRAASGGGDPGV